MKIIHKYETTTVLLLLSLLSACGGGSDGYTPIVDITPSYRIAKYYAYNASAQVTSSRTYEYDQSGYPTANKLDSKNDGSINHISTYEYDSSGRLFRILDDGGPDGKINAITTLYYESDILAKSKSEYYAQDGITLIQTDFMKYTTENNNITLVEYDQFDDGTIDSTGKYLYDNSGKLTKIITTTTSWSHTETHIYHASGRLDRITIDNDSDGIIESTKEYFYEEGPCVELIKSDKYLCSDK